MKITVKQKRIRLFFLFALTLLVFFLSGCSSNDAKNLVSNGIEDKSGTKISEVYNKKTKQEKTQFAKEVTSAYFQQAKSDMSKKDKPDKKYYKLAISLDDFLKHIDPKDENFTNLRSLDKLFKKEVSMGDSISTLCDQMELQVGADRLLYYNPGPIKQYTLYIYHKIVNKDYNPLYAAVESQEIGNALIGSTVIPSNNYVAVVHVPKDGVFADGAGLYTFYAARAEGDTFKFTDAGGFERSVPLLQFIFDEHVETVRELFSLRTKYEKMRNTIIPEFVDKVVSNPEKKIEIDFGDGTSSNSSSMTYIDNGYVNGVGVNLRKGPSMDAEVIRSLDHTNVQVISFVTDNSGREWAQVRLLEEGTTGYIAKEYFKHSVAGYRKDTEPSIGRGHIVGTNVIMRGGPAREADPIGEFNNNESVELLKFDTSGTGEQWAKVRRSNGDKGYVFGKFFQRD